MASIAIAARAYQQSFDTRPYTTLALTNGSLSAVGDSVAQLVSILVSKTDFEEENDGNLFGDAVVCKTSRP